MTTGKDNGNGGKVDWPTLVGLVVFVIASLGFMLGYVHLCYASNDRVDGLEGRMVRQESLLERMDGKIDKLLIRERGR